jgi:hypothetical protein
MIRETYDQVQLVVVGHHIIYKQEGISPQEIPSADYLIFNHDIAQKIWGWKWCEVLTKLALEPVATRDALLHKLYDGRSR